MLATLLETKAYSFDFCGKFKNLQKSYNICPSSPALIVLLKSSLDLHPGHSKIMPGVVQHPAVCSFSKRKCFLPLHTSSL